MPIRMRSSDTSLHEEDVYTFPELDEMGVEELTKLGGTCHSKMRECLEVEDCRSDCRWWKLLIAIEQTLAGRNIKTGSLHKFQ